jgi:hypothetical protein
MDPITGGLALGAVSGIGGAVLGSRANKKAQKARLLALAQARGELETGYGEATAGLRKGYSRATDQRKDVAGQIGTTGDETFAAQQELWAPWMVPGLKAYENLDRLTNDPNAFNASFQQYAQSPGFQFRMGEATKQIKRQAAAAGNRFGGAQAAALGDRADQVASQGYGEWFDRMTRNLGSLAQTGMQATGQIGQARDAQGRTRIGALEYGDTSQWDIDKSKELGQLSINKAQDFGNLALGTGGANANAALAKGQLQMGVLNDLTQLGSMALSGGFGGATPTPTGSAGGMALSGGFDNGMVSSGGGFSGGSLTQLGAQPLF